MFKEQRLCLNKRQVGLSMHLNLDMVCCAAGGEVFHDAVGEGEGLDKLCVVEVLLVLQGSEFQHFFDEG